MTVSNRDPSAFGPHHGGQLSANEFDAAISRDIDSLWQAYFSKLVAFARPQLSAAVAGIVDAEDIAASVLGSLCRVASSRRVTDQDNLWPLLVSISTRKLLEKKRFLFAEKRSLGKTVRLSECRIAGLTHEESNDFVALISKEPSPDVLASCKDLLESLLASEDHQTRQVVLLTLESLTNREIAMRLGCSERTVERKLAKFRGECRFVLK